jgi:hypothetical protein
MDNSSVCRICGDTINLVIVRERILGGHGFPTIAAQYDWDHHVPNDCIKILNRKLDKLLAHFGDHL